MRFMHMRRKPWARPELAACPYCISDPERAAGHYRAHFPAEQPLHVELGCGKGVSTAQMARENPQINYIAIDVSRDVLAVARRNIARAYGEAPIDNILLIPYDIGCIEKILHAEDVVERIYISFCNPWSEKKRHEKRRLTYPRQLEKYRTFLKPGGEIWFKTDDVPLFSDSLAYFEECGFEVRYRTDDLAASGFSPNYISEHEAKFMAEGLKIFFVIVRMKEIPQTMRRLDGENNILKRG